jgi:hypothetical protein
MYVHSIFTANTDLQQKPSVAKNIGNSATGREAVYIDFTECLKVQMRDKCVLVKNTLKNNKE